MYLPTRFATFGAVLILASVVGADEKDAKQDKAAARDDAAAGGPRQLIHANRLIGMAVRNNQNEDLGKIDEIILEESQDRVAYVVLSYGGWAGTDLQDKLFAVPFSSFKVDDKAGTATLNFTREKLKTAPGFDDDRYPDVASPSFAENVDKFYRQQAEAQREGGKKDVTAGLPERGEHWSQDWQAWRLRALSRVIGSDVEDKDAYNIGDIEDLLIDKSNGRLAYAIVSHGGAVGVNEKLAVIPWRALDAQPKDGQYTLAAGKEKLEASAYTDQTNLSDDAAARRLHEQFRTEPYWEAYGVEREADRKVEVEKGKVEVEKGDARADASVGWREKDEWVMKYDAAKQQKVSGEITSIGSFNPQPGASAGLQLRVRTDDGKMMSVLAGPTSYVRQQRVSIYPGQKAEITGSKAEFNGRDVLIAQEIRQGDQVLRLRDEQGKPQWKAEDLTDEGYYLRYREDNRTERREAPKDR